MELLVIMLAVIAAMAFLAAAMEGIAILVVRRNEEAQCRRLQK